MRVLVTENATKVTEALKQGLEAERYRAISYLTAFNRRITPMIQKTKTCFLLTALLFAPMPAWCYRPFESTDADVVDRGESEIELGYFNWERSAGENTYITPQLVYNYGLTDTWEMVAEFEVEHPSGESSELVDPGLFLKGVLQEGALQDQPGMSLAVEAGLLLPSTLPKEDRVGFEAIGILSGHASPFTYHINIGGGLDRADRDAFGLWGVIGEVPVKPGIRLVGEVNGEGVRGESPENSVLLGVIWEPASRSGLALDAAVRHGISDAASDWMITTGLSYSW